MKKAITLLLILLLAVSCVPVNAFALENRFEQSFVLAEITLNERSYEAGKETADFDLLYYDFLSNDSKKIYDACKDITPAMAMDYFASDSGVTVIPDDCPVKVSLYEQITQAQINELSKYVSRISQAAMDALYMDNMSFFWIAPFSLQISAAPGDDNNYSFPITVKPRIADRYSPNPQNYSNELYAVINSFDMTQTQRYYQVKSIHDYLCNTITYGSGTYAHEAYGGLIKGVGVCESYAESFKMLCDRFGIPCICVSGTGVTTTGSEGHKWNYVKMDDGKWYGVDVTWDDQYTIFYDFFLSGKNTKPVNFNQITFAESHITDGDFSGSGIEVFSYPILSDEEYGNGPYAAAVNGSGYTVDNTAKCVFGVLEETTVSEFLGNIVGRAEACTETSNTPISDKTTLVGTGSRMFSYAKPNEFFDIVITGEVDGNGTIETFDAVTILKYIAELQTPDNCRELASDVSHNGDIDTYDAVLLLQYIAELIDSL